jgi:hypothetical protein
MTKPWWKLAELSVQLPSTASITNHAVLTTEHRDAAGLLLRPGPLRGRHDRPPWTRSSPTARGLVRGRAPPRTAPLGGAWRKSLPALGQCPRGAGCAPRARAAPQPAQLLPPRRRRRPPPVVPVPPPLPLALPQGRAAAARNHAPALQASVCAVAIVAEKSRTPCR